MVSRYTQKRKWITGYRSSFYHPHHIPSSILLLTLTFQMRCAHSASFFPTFVFTQRACASVLEKQRLSRKVTSWRRDTRSGVGCSEAWVWEEEVYRAWRALEGARLGCVKE